MSCLLVKYMAFVFKILKSQEKAVFCMVLFNSLDLGGCVFYQVFGAESSEHLLLLFGFPPLFSFIKRRAESPIKFNIIKQLCIILFNSCIYLSYKLRRSGFDLKRRPSPLAVLMTSKYLLVQCKNFLNLNVVDLLIVFYSD